jgi:hypothetical protein
MLHTFSLKSRRFGPAALAIVLAGLVSGCASGPPSAAPADQTASVKASSGKPAKTKKPKIPKNVVFDEASAIVAGKEACLPISTTYDKEHWRAQNQRGVWRVWVTPVHCEGGGTCPTYEVHITAADGLAGECRMRVALN